MMELPIAINFATEAHKDPGNFKMFFCEIRTIKSVGIPDSAQRLNLRIVSYFPRQRT